MNLYWEVDDTIRDVLMYQFSVERSESSEGPWDLVIGGLRDVWFFSDTTVPKHRALKKVFYRLHIVEDGSGDEHRTDPIRVAPELDLVGREIVMRMSLLLREFTGRWVVLFPVRTFGTRCPLCWDNVRKRRTKENCPDCYGTGYAGGYMRPILTLVQINRQSPDARYQDKQATTEDRVALGLTWNYPVFKPDDVLVEAENHRWNVRRMMPTERLRATVQQQLTLWEIPPNHVTYKLKVPLDEAEFAPSPAREFNRPFDLIETDHRDFDLGAMLEAFGVRGTRR